MEHRCGKRYTLEVTASLDAKPSILTFGRLLNISASGVFVATSAALPVMTPVRVQLEWGKFRDSRYCMAGYVVRTDPRGVGIEWREFASFPVLALINDLEDSLAGRRLAARDREPARERRLPGQGSPLGEWSTKTLLPSRSNMA